MSTKTFVLIMIAVGLACAGSSTTMIVQGPQFSRENPNPWVSPKAAHNRVLLVSEDAVPILRAYLADADAPTIQGEEAEMECTEHGWFTDVPESWKRVELRIEIVDPDAADADPDDATIFYVGTYPLTVDRLQVVIVPNRDLPDSPVTWRKADLMEARIASRDHN